MTNFNPVTSQALATKLRSLHIPGNPVVFTNIWDPPSASLALKFEKTKALATASFAIAASVGVEDDELTLENNVAAVSRIRELLVKEGRAEEIPLTCDLQDGYRDKLESSLSQIIDLGVVGCNLEDSRMENGKQVLIDVEEHVERVKKAIRVAKEKGVPGFVVNARSDCVLLGGTVEEAVERGKKYLEAGACTVFVWGGLKRGLRDDEVRQLVRGLDGRLNVICRKGEGMLGVNQIKELGVARISMGPGLWRVGIAAVENEMKSILEEIL